MMSMSTDAEILEANTVRRSDHVSASTAKKAAKGGAPDETARGVLAMAFSSAANCCFSIFDILQTKREKKKKNFVLGSLLVQSVGEGS